MLSVDTAGLGQKALREQTQHMPPTGFLMGPRLARYPQTALESDQAPGLSAYDVRHILLPTSRLRSAGGLPPAQLSGRSASSPTAREHGRRYALPAFAGEGPLYRAELGARPKLAASPAKKRGDTWFGFARVRPAKVAGLADGS